MAKRKIQKAPALAGKQEPGEPVHSFGRTRPSQTGAYPIHVQPERDTKFRPLPPSTGPEPFHLNLGSIIASADYQSIVGAKKLTLHVNGDMGGIKFGMPQQLVAKGMEQDFDPKASASDNPAFLYIVGDCVYYNGQDSEYYAQFYEPYEFYPRPIFAVPGNHDGENVLPEESLNGFVRNFCAPSPVKMPEAQDSNRTAMTQPNVYWTLLTPLASFVGLYSNVPSGGEIDEAQTAWLVNELRNLPKSIPVIVTLHHPIYSADDHHSGSTAMKTVIEQAAEEAGRHPEMILAGHVHNYQRLTKTMTDGSQIPYLVTGAGGYYNLHHMMKVNDEQMIPPVTFQDKTGDPVTLDRYSADHHGFMRLEITDKLITGRYYAVPRPQESYSKGSQLIDYFEYDWVQRKYVPNSLPTPDPSIATPTTKSFTGRRVRKAQAKNGTEHPAKHKKPQNTKRKARAK
jgi:Icc-related predicted phosphoesterase